MSKILLAVRSGLERQGWIHPLLNRWLVLQMFERGHQISVDFIIGVSGLAGSANGSSKAFMENPMYADYEWLCIIDNDTVPPPDMMRMMDNVPEEVDIISPLCMMTYRTRIFPQQGFYINAATGQPLYENGDDVTTKSIFKPLSDLSPGLHLVDRVGGGYWFIRRRVFEHMQKPYFKVFLDPVTYETTVTDDCYFQDAARTMGCCLVCDTRYVASHFHTVDLTQFFEGVVSDENAV